MAGNTADPFGDYDDDAWYDVSDTEEEDLADTLDGDMSGPDFEDVIPVGHGHYYCLVDRMGLERYYQIMRASSSGTGVPQLHSYPPLRRLVRKQPLRPRRRHKHSGVLWLHRDHDSV